MKKATPLQKKMSALGKRGKGKSKRRGSRKYYQELVRKRKDRSK